MKGISPDSIDVIVDKIIHMPKYKGVDIPVGTIRSLAEKCAPASKNAADLEKRVRGKIHNIVASWLGDADYDQAKAEFNRIKGEPEAVKEFSRQTLMLHSSTKERGLDLALFYQVLFEQIGKADRIADLACGLHPLGLPYMGLPKDAAYYAYDLNKARADFLNDFILGLGYGGGCFHRDILLDPPAIRFDAAFFFKEAQRFEKREPGVMPAFIDSIMASKVVVSLPLQGLGSRNPLPPAYGAMIRRYAEGRGMPLKSFAFGNEIFYIIDKRN